MKGVPASRLQSCVFCLTGPTAVGKSKVALHLAERLNGEIISVDSMQVYCGLDVGTAKPSLDDRRRVPHHLIDVVGLSDCFDAAQFVRLAGQALEDIRARGRLPILCGGTGLYFNAFFDGLGQSPAQDAGLRAELEASPLSELLRELAQRDALAYESIDRKNPRRVIRALEVIRLTGQAYSSQRAAWSRAQSNEGRVPAFFGLVRSIEDLRRRIEGRVDAMFQQGLVGETRALLERGLSNNRTALQALGYRQVAEHLQGVRSLHDTIALVKTRTRQYAKRQMTWFRRQLPVRWLEVTPHQSADHIAAEVVRQVSSLGVPAPEEKR